MSPKVVTVIESVLLCVPYRHQMSPFSAKQCCLSVESGHEMHCGSDEFVLPKLVLSPFIASECVKA
jgi:hypothetical protein